MTTSDKKPGFAPGPAFAEELNAYHTYEPELVIEKRVLSENADFAVKYLQVT